MSRREIIQNVLKEYPGAPKKTLAKLLRERYPLEFTSVENARSAIRGYTGALGAKATTIPIVEDKRKPGTLRIPKGYRQSKAPVQLSTPGKYLITSDWHVPYHDHESLEAAIRHGIDSGCEHFYLNGDAVDFYKLSRWEKDPRRRSTGDELKTLWEILDDVLPHFSGRKFYKVGNHEDRLTRRIWESTPELAVLPRFDVAEVLELKERGLEVVESKRFAKLGPLAIFHGHELPKGLTSPVNIARGVWLRVQDPAIVAHWHRTSSHVETSGVKDRITTCYSQGCLCDRRPEYAVVNAWNPGFIIAELSAKKAVRVTNYIIDRGAVEVAG